MAGLPRPDAAFTGPAASAGSASVGSAEQVDDGFGARIVEQPAAHDVHVRPQRAQDRAGRITRRKH